MKNTRYLKIVQRDAVDGGYGLKKSRKYFKARLSAAKTFFDRGKKSGYGTECDTRDLIIDMYFLIITYFFGDPILDILWEEKPLSKKRIEERKAHIKYLFGKLS